MFYFLCLCLLRTLILNKMKKEQFTHNIAKAKRLADAERQKELIKKYEKDFDNFLTKLQLNHLTK